jgi:hypothetical protein
MNKQERKQNELGYDLAQSDIVSDLSLSCILVRPKKKEKKKYHG